MADPEQQLTSVEYKRCMRDILKRIDTNATYSSAAARCKEILGKLPDRNKEKILTETLIKYYNNEELKPYQAELIKMQAHLERTGKKMIILVDGRDASGRGGCIRQLTRYMNEKR